MLLLGLVLASPRPTVAQSPNEDVVSDVLEVLTAEQAEAFAAGADPSTLILADGETLERFLERLPLGGGAEPLDFVTVDSCSLLRTNASLLGKMTANEIRPFLARGETTDFSDQGGSAIGCGIPVEAVALMLSVTTFQPDGTGRLKGWPVEAPQPGGDLLVYQTTTDALDFFSLAVVGLCDLADPCTAGDFNLRTVTSGTHVRAEVAGFYVPAADSDPTNELNQSAALVGDELQVTDAGGTVSADLSSLATETELSAHEALADAHREHATLEESSEIDADVAAHALVATAHHPAVTLDGITPTTTKGDLLVEDGANVVRLPVGTDGQALVADSSQSAGVAWGTVVGDWSAPETISLTDNAGGAIKGGTTIDQVRWRVNGQNYEVEYRYRQTTAGSGGSPGEYLIGLPSGVQIDTAFHPTIEGIGAGGGPNGSGWVPAILDGNGWIGSPSHNASGHLLAAAVDADTLQFFSMNFAASKDAFGSNHYPLWAAELAFTITVSFKGEGL